MGGQAAFLDLGASDEIKVGRHRSGREERLTLFRKWHGVSIGGREVVRGQMTRCAKCFVRARSVPGG